MLSAISGVTLLNVGVNNKKETYDRSFPPTIFHVLCDNVDWLLGNNSEEADKTRML